MVEARIDSDKSRAGPPLSDAQPQPFEGDPQRLGSPPKKWAMWPVMLILLLVFGAATIYFWWHGAAPPVAAPSTDRAPASATPPTGAAPEIRYPLEGASPKAEQAPLPSLQDSDGPVLDGLAGVVASDALDKIVQREDIVRRIVATVDNLPRRTVAPRLLPVKPVPGPFATAGSGDTITIGANNAARYAPYVRVVEAVDAKTLAALYIRFYPLFQQAYRDLGYPSGYFNDRLVEAIDDLLAAPGVQAPIRLTQPKVLYEYADPELEQRSAGQKMMMRMGSNDAARVKAKLTQFRREVVGPNAKQ